MIDLQNKSIAILGYGVNNREVAQYLVRKGYSITILDKDTAATEQATFTEEEAARVTWEIVSDVTDNLKRFNVVFRSPGFSFELPGIKEAQEAGTVFTSQTSYFFELTPAKTIGITGTKGKGTTSTLIAKVLEAGYSKGKVYLAGNIGLDPFSFIEELTEEDIVVLELSSFQLEDCPYSPDIAVLLHVTLDHLEHHGSLQNYRRAKANLLANQQASDLAIINTGYSDMEEYRAYVRGKVIEYTRQTPLPFSVADRKLRGEHNLENIIPAYLVGKEFGIPDDVIQKVVLEFPGLAHRLSFVGEVNGVAFYDDSIATTPESSQVAVEAFAGRPIHLILGGRDKGADYAAFAQSIAPQCASIYLLPGNTAKAFERGFANAFYTNFQEVPDAPAAVAAALAVAQPGDVVLLAPGTRSDIPYSNYAERGDDFAQAVRSRMVE